jgi:hypothetical protein
MPFTAAQKKAIVDVLKADLVAGKSSEEILRITTDHIDAVVIPQLSLVEEMVHGEITDLKGEVANRIEAKTATDDWYNL